MSSTTAAELKDAIWDREIELHHEAEGRRVAGISGTGSMGRAVLFHFLADRNIR